MDRATLYTTPEHGFLLTSNPLCLMFAQGNTVPWLSFLGHYSCYGLLLTSVTKVNIFVPAKLFTGKDNGSYSSPTPAPNVGLPKWQYTATQYLLDATAQPARSAKMVTS